MGFGGAIPTPGQPTGGGAANANIQVPGYQGSGIDQMNRAFANMQAGINMRNDMLMKNKQLAQQQSQFDQQMKMKQEEQNLNNQYKQQQMQMDQEKMAMLQKQQAIQAQRDQEKAERDRVKGEMDLVDWKNKQQAQQVMMNNLPTIDKLLNDGVNDDELYNSEQYQQTLSALAILDPKAASTFFTDAQKRRYTNTKDVREAASYSTIAPIYTEGFPQVIDAINSGRPVSEAIAPVKTKLDQLYGTGQISPTVYKQSLKDYVELIQTTSRKLSGASTPDRYISYDKNGNVTNNPNDTVKQVSSKTGKISSVGRQASWMDDLMGGDEEQETSSPQKENSDKKDFWSSIFGGNE